MSTTRRPPGLLDAVKAKLENEVFKAPSAQARQLGSVLVCDDCGLSILESAFKVNDLTRHGIPLVESLSLTTGVSGGRQSLSRNPVIYFCRATVQNMERILEDWRPVNEHNPRRDWTTRPYLEAHIFFCSKATDDVTGLLVPHKFFLSHLRTCKEVSLDFLALEPHLYTTNGKPDLKTFFGKDTSASDMDTEAEEVANRIIDVVNTMGDTVTVRHHKQRAGVAQLVANKVVDAQKKRLGVKQGTATLLILDRSIDPVAPLLHELTYQAMLLDVVPNDTTVVVRPDPSIPSRARVKWQEKERKPGVIDENDEIWCRLRHKHIADNGSVLSTEFQALISNSKALSLKKNAGAGGPSTEAMADAVKELPAVQAKLTAYKLHIDMHEILMKLVRAHSLDKACELEQSLATLENNEGGKVDKEQLKKEYEAFLHTSCPNAYFNKLRILLLFVISQGALSKDRLQKWIQSLGSPKPHEGLTQLARPDVVETVITNLARFDIATEKTKWYQAKSKKKDKRSITRADDAYDMSRYVPSLKKIAENLVAAPSDLSEMEFPHTVPEEANVNGGTSSSVAPAGGRGSRRTREGGYGASKQSTWGTSLRQGDGAAAQGGGASSGSCAHPDALPWALEKVKGRAYIFIVGGVTLSETRSIAETICTKDTEVIIGSTSLLTPLSFVRNLASL